MNDSLLDMWASSPRQTAHLGSAQPGAPVIPPRRPRHPTTQKLPTIRKRPTTPRLPAMGKKIPSEP